MKTIARGFIAAALIAIANVSIASASSPATAMTIDGHVYDGSTPVPNVTVVAWCDGGITFFGGSDTTDANGYYIIKTDSDACPLGRELTVTTDIDHDGRSDGAAHTTSHTQSTISIELGKYTTFPVPEYDWAGFGVTGIAGIVALHFARRKYSQRATA